MEHTVRTSHEARRSAMQRLERRGSEPSDIRESLSILVCQTVNLHLITHKAGLFSAVVTAFIIESYKTLKPDPNDTIISLLSIIANRLDNTTTPIPVLLSSTGPGSHCSPAASSIRINNFWFISLVLSLATVLTGTISLQWIREHQNYPNLTPRDRYALFNMRAEGLKKWHIPKIFTALPLLLQSALVLFFVGIIDFLLAFGDVGVVIPVSMVTILVLLFLVITTMLPTVQGFLMCLPYLYSRASPMSPSQCPYKSPQAHAFRVMLSSVIQLCHKLYTGESLLSKWWYKPINLVVCVMITWTKKTWTEFDMAWLKLRHQFMQHYDLDKGSYPRDPSDVDNDPPIFDLAQALRAHITSQDTNVIKNSLSAQYHCFSEVSKWVTDRETDQLHDEPLQAIIQSNEYLRDIMLNVGRYFVSFTGYCDISTHVESRAILHPSKLSSILHQENMFFFLQSLYRTYKDFDTGITKHQLELAMRLSTDIHYSHYKHSTAALGLPDFLFEPFFVGNDKYNDALQWQWVNNFSKFFQSAEGVQKPYIPGGTLQTHQATPRLIWYFTFVSLERTFSQNEGLRPAIQGKFIDTFRMITENLNEQMSLPDFREPNLLFYLTGLYLCATKLRHKTYHVCLDGLISAMRTYKERTIDAGIINSDLEEIYSGPVTETLYEGTFSSKWWDFLDSPRDRGDSSISRRSPPSVREHTGVTAPASPDS
ncbi:hypothetical protein GALMADRAFT_872538 [Galerina marginata CBS 339.88]|uniref:DUF6535 domain-containing protein n=1 Tax=Galerina marginata (strain CBS 339.88) TaxID=685588 RepID=A0A067TVW4_GALM3|nr:hypothetical protein GALMADRAFT_872538 [Galerina marginata CBS 339.88]